MGFLHRNRKAEMKHQSTMCPSSDEYGNEKQVMKCVKSAQAFGLGKIHIDGKELQGRCLHEAEATI